MDLRRCTLTFVFVVLNGCGGAGSAGPTAAVVPTPAPAPTPSGQFALTTVAPIFGATITSSFTDLQGIVMDVRFRASPPETVNEAFFVLALLNGTTECLRSQIAYCTRTEGGSGTSFPAGAFTGYSCRIFIRDNQQPSCGLSFTTNRVRLLLQERGSPRTVFTADADGGWSFQFAR